MNHQLSILNAIGTVSCFYEDKGFGFLHFATASGRVIRLFFHFGDTDGTAFKKGDKVCFDLGSDSQGRARAYNVKFISDGSVESRRTTEVDPEVRRGNN